MSACLWDRLEVKVIFLLDCCVVELMALSCFYFPKVCRLCDEKERVGGIFE